MHRSAMRELAFQMVYGLQFQEENHSEQVDIFIENNGIEELSVQEYLRDIQKGLEEHKQEIDGLIESNLKENWRLNRVSKVNLSLMKIAIYEMVYKKLPYKVAINEVIELAKKYSDETGSMFVNGVLASVVKVKNLSEKADEK